MTSSSSYEDLLVAAVVARRWIRNIDEHPTGPGLWPCQGPFNVRWDSSTGSISEVTPDPETRIWADVSCPHREGRASIRYFGELPELIEELRSDARLRDWVPLLAVDE